MDHAKRRTDHGAGHGSGQRVDRTPARIAERRAQDRELVTRFRDALTPVEQERALDAVYRTYRDPVIALCAVRLGDPHAAEDVSSDTFIVAFRKIRSGYPDQPELLGAWLFGIARNLCRKEIDKRRRTSPTEALADTEEDVRDALRKVDARRVERLLESVVATFTERQREVYDLAFVQGLRGKDLAAALGVAVKSADNAVGDSFDACVDGLGALLLAREGWNNCPALAGILDEYAWRGDNFTRTLRQRIVRHINICPTCDACGTCRTQRDRLVRAYTPRLVPVLITPSVDRRVRTELHSWTPSPPPPPPPPTYPPGLPMPAAEHRPTRVRRPHSRGVRYWLPHEFLSTLIIVVALLTSVALTPPSPGGASRPAAGTGTTARSTLASAVSAAMVRSRFADADIEVRNFGAAGWFNGLVRLDIADDANLNVETRVDRDLGEGHAWVPPQVVLIDDRAWASATLFGSVGNTPIGTPTPLAASPDTTNTDLSRAMLARWLVSPAHLALLLDHAVSVDEAVGADGSRVLSGSAPLNVLAGDRDGALMYRPYLDRGPASRMVAFTLRTDVTYLPTNLNVDVPVTRVENPDERRLPPMDPFTVEYRAWAAGQPVTAPTTRH